MGTGVCTSQVVADIPSELGRLQGDWDRDVSFVLSLLPPPPVSELYAVLTQLDDHGLVQSLFKYETDLCL